MNTRRYPRTMADAFGPYTSNDLEPMPDNRPMDWQDKVVLAGSAITSLIFIGFVITGVLA